MLWKAVRPVRRAGLNMSPGLRAAGRERRASRNRASSWRWMWRICSRMAARWPSTSSGDAGEEGRAVAGAGAGSASIRFCTQSMASGIHSCGSSLILARLKAALSWFQQAAKGRPDTWAHEPTSARKGLRSATLDGVMERVPVKSSGVGEEEAARCSASSLSSTSSTQRRKALATGVRANMATRWQPRREKMREGAGVSVVLKLMTTLISLENSS